MSDYPAGTVAVATVRGVPNVRIVRCLADDTACWFSPAYQENVGGNGWWPDEDEVADIRPLVVLDLSMQDNFQASIEAGLRNLRDSTSRAARFWIADQIEAQTKPPRIDEPGLWGVVEVRDQYYVRESLDPQARAWNPIGERENVTWEELVQRNPFLIREGVQ